MKISKYIVIIVLAIFIIACGVSFINCFSNKAIILEEKINSSISDIKIQEKARYDTVYNLADCVKQYDKHEAETLICIAENMSKGKTENKDVQTIISAVTYSYPELKSNVNYQKFMDILTLTERKIADYRETYNRYVENYRKYCRKFPNKQILSVTNYEIKEFERIDFKTSENAPTNLFNMEDGGE